MHFDLIGRGRRVEPCHPSVVSYSGRRRAGLGRLGAGVISNLIGQFAPALRVISLVVTLAGAAPAAWATPIVDQSFLAPQDLAAFINEGFDIEAQSFTAGVTGDLVGVRVNIQYGKSSSLRISIYDMLDSMPNNLLGITTLSTSESPIGDTITLSTPVSIVAGSTYLIAADYPGISKGLGQYQGVWSGASADLYAGGNTFVGDFESGDSGPVSWAPETFDLHFETLVNPVPEPASIVLSALGLFAVALLGWRRRMR